MLLEVAAGPVRAPALGVRDLQQIQVRERVDLERERLLPPLPQHAGAEVLRVISFGVQVQQCRSEFMVPVGGNLNIDLHIERTLPDQENVGRAGSADRLGRYWAK